MLGLLSNIVFNIINKYHKTRIKLSNKQHATECKIVSQSSILPLPSVPHSWRCRQHVQPPWTTCGGGVAECRCYREEAEKSGAGGHALGLHVPMLQEKKPPHLMSVTHLEKWQKTGWLLLVCTCGWYMCAPHTRCWWRPCRALLLAAAQACLWGTLSVMQPRRGRCAPRPNEPPIPGQIPCKAGRDSLISQSSSKMDSVIQYEAPQMRSYLPHSLSGTPNAEYSNCL